MPMNAVYRGPAELPQVIPVFPLPGALLLPRGQMPLNIFEPRYVAMVDDALAGRRVIGMIQPDPTHRKSDVNPKLYRIGCVGRLIRAAIAPVTIAVANGLPDQRAAPVGVFVWGRPPAGHGSMGGTGRSWSLWWSPYWFGW